MTINQLLTREPMALVGAVVALIEATVAALPLFGVPLTAEQVGAIMAIVVALAYVAKLAAVRPLVTPVADPRLGDGTPATLTALDRQALIDRLDGLSLDDLDLVTFAAGLEPDNIPGETAALRVRELVAYAERRGKLAAVAVAAGSAL